MSDEERDLPPCYTRGELDEALAEARAEDGGDEDDDKIVWFSAPCHDEAGLDVVYVGGEVYLACHECGEAICTVPVADARPMTEVN